MRLDGARLLRAKLNSPELVNEKVSGTGSSPPSFQGWQLQILRRLNSDPFAVP